MCLSSDKTEHMQDAEEGGDESIIKGRYLGKWGIRGEIKRERDMRT